MSKNAGVILTYISINVGSVYCARPFEEMLLSSYKYSYAINAKGKEYSTEILFMSLIFEQHKKMIFWNSNHNNLTSSSRILSQFF